ncbi:hypothetical protein [Streptomyces sp. NPDC001020]
MKETGALTGVVIFVAWLVWNLLNVFRIVGGLRNGSWRRPMWWTRLCSLSLFAGLASWLRGVFVGGLDVGETCQFVHHEHYDSAYRNAHAEEFHKLFPLHDKCNAHYDMVPAWVNPTIVICTAVGLVAIAALVWFGTAHLATWASRSARRPTGSSEGDRLPVSLFGFGRAGRVRGRSGHSGSRPASDHESTPAA